MKRIFFILFLLPLSLNAQVVEDIEFDDKEDKSELKDPEGMWDPAFCYYIESSEPIRPIKSKTGYKGKIIITAEIDTSNLTLKRHNIMRANLTNSSNDSIYVVKGKSGNLEVLETILTEIIDHLRYLKIAKDNTKYCILGRFHIPIKLE